MATRKPTTGQTSEPDTSASESDRSVFTTSTPTPAADADTRPVAAPGTTPEDVPAGAEFDRDAEPELTEEEAADQVASVQSGFATREVPPMVELVPPAAAAMNAATPDGMPVPVDRSTKMITDPESGAIVSVPADYEPADSDDDSQKDEDKA